MASLWQSSHAALMNGEPKLVHTYFDTSRCHLFSANNSGYLILGI